LSVDVASTTLFPEIMMMIPIIRPGMKKSNTRFTSKIGFKKSQQYSNLTLHR
jgi:hypothetical protein